MLKGFPEAIEAAYPACEVQRCIVHMVRNSLNFVSWKQRKEVAADLQKYIPPLLSRRRVRHSISLR